MALVIKPHHRKAFGGLMDQMFKLRRRIFVERMGWELDTDGVREIDQFDSGDCLYLLALDDDGRVRASSRYTPSLQPNVTCDVLQQQMHGDFPRGPHIWEVSRHCVDPDLDPEARKQILQDLRVSQWELASSIGWTHSLGVSYDRHIQPFVRAGFKVEILGRPFRFPGDKEFAFCWMVSQNPERPNAILDFVGADHGRLQDPDEDPNLFARYGDRLAQEA